MPSLNIPLCLILLFFITQSSSKAASAFGYFYCPNTTTTHNITSNSYYSNRNLLLSTLSNASSDYQFYNFSVGHDNNSERIYGLFMCRGDLPREKCQDFVTRAVKDITSLCPDKETAVLWSEDCLLRYSNRLKFPDPDYRLIIEKPYRPFVLRNTNKIASDEQGRFKKRLGEMMNEVATQAASDHRSIDKKFASREYTLSVHTTIYVLAQCIPYMSNSSCRDCLGDLIKVLHNCCDEDRGARVQYTSCFMRHEVYRFYNIDPGTFYYSLHFEKGKLCNWTDI